MGERERPRRRAAVAVGLWVLVVATGSWLVWTVISAAGGTFVGGEGGPPLDDASAGSQPTHPPPPAGSAAPTRTWSGGPGVVTVRCTGTRIALGGAAATAAGYAVDVGARGPALVEVEFQQRPDGRDVTVRAHCEAGRPVFSVTQDN